MFPRCLRSTRGWLSVVSFVLRVFFCLGGLRFPSSTSTRTTSGSELVAVGAVVAVVVTAVELIEAAVVVEVAVVVVE